MERSNIYIEANKLFAIFLSLANRIPALSKHVALFAYGFVEKG